jgi:agmatine deiminase
MGATLETTPMQDGYRMPGEFEPHAGCWMAWPERRDNWRDGARPAQEAVAAVAAAIASSEPVTMAVSDAQFERACSLLCSGVRVVELSSDDAWMRDIGPTFVVSGAGELRGVDWHFNAWGGREGGLYSSWERDERVARKVLEIEEAGRYRAPIVLEGGAIHVDGEGTVLATEQCLLNPNRNPELAKAQIEQVLCAYLGAGKVIWLGAGLCDDESDGHVDNLACFARPGVVLLAYAEHESDPQRAVCAAALARLEAATDGRGRPLEVVRLPLPAPVQMSAEEARGVLSAPGTKPRRAGDRLAASYVNFYPGTATVVFPLLDTRYDEQAREILQACFPDREIVGVAAREILLGGGGIHCITQQVPRRAASVTPRT